jgi:ubiquinone/menaquinone biosynthesis C-methylase UbiE
MFARQFDPALPERMDVSQPVSRELEIDLANLTRINRHFGSYRLVRRFLRRWLEPGNHYRILDLCTGAGDIPRFMVDWARPRHITLAIDAVDFQAATLEIASRGSAGYPQIAFRQGDVLELGEPAQPAYDFVFCSLALHHFSAPDAVRLLAKCRRLAGRGVLVADLERSGFAAVGVWLLTAVLYREPMTKFDARLSVRRAFSFAEFGELARKAGWTGFGQARFALARQAVWLERLSRSNLL